MTASARACLACCRPLPAHQGPGRPSSYCGRGCRRVAERELTRLDELLTWAENRLVVLRRNLDGIGRSASDTTASLRRELEWWEAERVRVVDRQAAVLDAAPETPNRTED